MCLFHDLGEAVTGDVPCFKKKDCDREAEKRSVREIAALLSESHKKELLKLIQELEENETPEAKLVHALDKLEALIQHDEAPMDRYMASP